MGPSVVFNPSSLRRSATRFQDCGNDGAEALNELVRRTSESADAWGEDDIGTTGHQLFDGIRRLALRFDAELVSGLTDISYGLYRMAPTYDDVEDRNTQWPR